MELLTGKGLLVGMWLTLKHLFRPAITIQYPKVKPEVPARSRGRHGIRVDENGETLCIGCKACERVCPDRLITVKTSKAPEGSAKKLIIDDFTLELDACIFCGLCVEACPTQALVMTSFYEMACRDRADIRLTKEKLLESGKDYELPA